MFFNSLILHIDKIKLMAYGYHVPMVFCFVYCHCTGWVINNLKKEKFDKAYNERGRVEERGFERKNGGQGRTREGPHLRTIPRIFLAFS